MTISCLYVGIDVSKDHLDIFDPQHGLLRVANTAKAVAAWALTPNVRGRFVIFEATGSYDRALRHQLEAAGIPFSRVNPERARDFARATGRRAKTDPVDAKMLSELGRRFAPNADDAIDPQREELALCHKRRDQLVAMRAQESVRRSESQDPRLAADITRHIAWLDQEIAELEAQIKASIRSDPDLREIQSRLRSVPGVGLVTSTTLIALMPELGQRSPGSIAALAGLAPFNNDSGKRSGQRSIQGGRRRVRRALYMAALSASRSKTKLGAFYKNLRDQNRPAKVALIALARKILVILNAIMRDKTNFARA
jgi:transposase